MRRLRGKRVADSELEMLQFSQVGYLYRGRAKHSETKNFDSSQHLVPECFSPLMIKSLFHNHFVCLFFIKSDRLHPLDV